MTEELSPETEEKQNYLRDNILDKGYDVNDFIAYLIDKKGEGGDDIANWSLPDLKAIVNEYIAHKEQEKMENKIEDNGENKEENLQNDDKNIILDKNEPAENTENTENIQQEIQQSKATYGVTDFKEIECQKLELSTLGKTENLSISITGFEKKEGKLFAKAYTVYIIKTSPLNLIVKRRFSDFEWLRQVIVNCYNYCSIPGIPRKTKMADKFSEAFIRKRARTFEKFLSYLVIHPVLKNLKVVYEFLSIEKDSDFQKMKKTYEKSKLPAKVSDFVTMEGTANIEINSTKDKQLRRIKEIAHFNELGLKKIKNNMRSLKDDLLSAQIKLKEISINCGIMRKKALEFGEDENVVYTYEELSSMFQNLSLNFAKLNFYIFVNLREYLKYVSKNYHSLRELIHSGEHLKNNYYKSYKNLTTKKEDYFKKVEVTKWDFPPNEKIDKFTIIKDKNLALEKMLYKETLSVISLKEKYGFYLNRIIYENERMKKMNSVFHVRYINNILEKFQKIASSLLIGFEDNYKIMTAPKGERANAKKSRAQTKKVEEEENMEKIDEDISIKKEGK